MGTSDYPNGDTQAGQPTNEPDEENEENHSNSDQTQVEILLEIASSLELFHDQNGDAFIVLNGQCFKLTDKRVKQFLSFQMYLQIGKAPNPMALTQAIKTLEGIAIFNRQEVQLENRIAQYGEDFLYDMGDHRSVIISAEGWKIIESPPKFRRHNHQSIQVDPTSGGDVYKLFDFINVSSQNQLLVLVTLISYFVPGIPHPIFHPWGPQGSGKTSLFKAFKRLVDPSSAETLMCSSDRGKVIHALLKHYVPLFDNLSRLDGETSDLLCQACTGGGIEQRQLYTDDDSVIFQILRCVGVNGINLSIIKPDLLDRTLLLHLERIRQEQRQEDKVLWAEFEKARPHILGGIFDKLSLAMMIHPHVKLDKLPRLADFGRWGYAIAESFKEGLGETFIKDYQNNVELQIEEVIQSNTLATTLLRFMTNRDSWETTVATAFTTLKYEADPDHYDRTFPRAPKELRRHLERIRATLEEKNITYKIGARTSEGYPIIFHRITESCSSGSSSAQWPEADEPNEAFSDNYSPETEGSIPDFDF